MSFPFQPNIFGGFPQPTCTINPQYDNTSPYQQFEAENSQNILIEKLRNELPPTFTRQFVCEKLGGILTPKTLANLDSLCEGPASRIRIGKKIGYERDDFLTWFEKRIKNQ